MITTEREWAYLVEPVEHHREKDVDVLTNVAEQPDVDVLQVLEASHLDASHLDADLQALVEDQEAP